MEYIHFDNKEIDNFIKEITGKEKYTIDDIMFALEDENIIQKEKSILSYMIEEEEYESGIILEEPKKIIEIKTGFENRINLREIIKENSNIELQANENSISIQDFEYLVAIEKRLDLEIIREDEIDTIGIKDENFHVFGSEFSLKLSSKYDFEESFKSFENTINFENASEDELKRRYEWIQKQGYKLNEKFFSSFKGITAKKLEILGEDNYYIERDLGNPYNRNEILQLLNIMESMKENTKDCNEDIDKFLPVYKSIGMHADYDNSGNKESEEYIEGNEKLTRSLRGVLLQGRAVCAGYAHALYVCLNYIGVEASYVGGEIFDNKNNSLGGHAWNQVKIQGEWYNCDLTWDKDGIRKKGILKCCLKSDEEFDKGKSYIRKKNFPNKVKRCPKSFDPKVIQEKMNSLRYTDLDEFSFDATSDTRVGEKELEQEFTAAIQEDPIFSKVVMKALTTEEKKKTIER